MSKFLVVTHASRLLLLVVAIQIAYQSWSGKPFSFGKFMCSYETIGLVVGVAAGYFVFYVVPKLTSRKVEHPEDDGA